MRLRFRSASRRSGRSAGSAVGFMRYTIPVTEETSPFCVMLGRKAEMFPPDWRIAMSEMSVPVPAGTAAGVTRTPGRSRWLILAVIGIAQLMVVLDMTVMNIALPSAQHDLGFNNVDRQWVVTAYSLSFGSLLLFCGRLADLIGRKITFITGLAGFAIASAVGGASVNFAVLVTARACQGVFGALLAPAALSLLTTTFSDPKERGKAF